MHSATGLAVVVVVDMAGGGWVGGMKDGRYLAEKINKMAGGTIGGTMEFEGMKIDWQLGLLSLQCLLMQEVVYLQRSLPGCQVGQGCQRSQDQG